MVPFNEFYKQVRDVQMEWTAPFHEWMISSDTEAINLAKLVFQSLIIIHGGALVSLPAFRGILLHRWQPIPTSFIVMFAIFGLGLFFAILGTAFGFHALAYRSEAYGKRISEQIHRSWDYVGKMNLQNEVPGSLKPLLANDLTGFF